MKFRHLLLVSIFGPWLYGQNVETELIQFFRNDVWENSSRKLYSYDTANLLSLKENQAWLSSSWEPRSDEIYIRLNDGRLDSLIRIDQRPGVFREFEREKYHYSAIWQLDSVILESDYRNNGMQKNTRERYRYNVQGNPSEIITEKWRQGSYHYEEKWEQSFRPDSNLLNHKIFYHDSGAWRLDRELIYSYQPNGSLDEILCLNSAADTAFRYTYHYTLGGELSHAYFLIPFGSVEDSARYDYHWSNQGLLDTMVYSIPRINNPGLSPHVRWIYQYQSNIGLAEEQNFEMEVFPNPATSFVNIHSKLEGPQKIKLYTLSGRLVMEQTLEGPAHRLSLSSYPRGNYILQLSSEFGAANRFILLR